MAVFRIEKTKDYTVMANHHLRNRALSLKAKGLLSLMLSLPDDWDYTTKGLAHICKDGVDSISATVRELEKAGYVKRRRLRNAQGQLAEVEYTILEQPEPAAEAPEDASSPKRENPVLDNPVQGFPVLDNPVLGKPEQAKPVLENPAQLNTKKSSTQKQNTFSINPSFIPSGAAPPADGLTDGLDKRAEILEQIEYEFIRDRFNRDQLDELVEIMLEVALNRSPTMKIGRDAEYPTAYVQQRFEQITSEHIEKVMDGISENTTRVWNTKAYLMAALFNSVSTLGNHYTMLVNHDFHSG